MAETGKDTDKAAHLILEGKLVAIPTETVYGLAANALDEKAVLSVFKAKQRPFFDPLIVHVPSIDAVKKYAILHNDKLAALASAFWPGPLTLLLPKKEIIPDIVTSGLPQVAVRIPDHDLTLQLLNKANVPIAAPSANPFGYISPTEPEHVNKQLGDKIDYILDGGSSKVGLESTIVGIEDEKVCVYRLGGLALEDIEKVVGKPDLRLNTSSDPRAPGQLKNHYAPAKPLFVGDLEKLVPQFSTKKIALLCFGEEKFQGENIVNYNLSETKNLNEAAINLFKFLRLADQSYADVVICEKMPEKGLGRAINDRLQRASVK
jgi:L-threonylcarbamoyladenylate synthase